MFLFLPPLRLFEPFRAHTPLITLSCIFSNADEKDGTRHGAQNAYDAASKATLENEFGTQNEDECMIKILEGGSLQETEVGFFYILLLGVVGYIVFLGCKSR